MFVRAGWPGCQLSVFFMAIKLPQEREFRAVLISPGSAFSQGRAPERLVWEYVEPQMSSAQNTPSAKVAYFGVEYSDPL